MVTPSVFRDGAHSPLNMHPDNAVDDASLWNRSSGFVSINTESRLSATSPHLSMGSGQDVFLHPPREDSPPLISPMFVISSSGTIRSPSPAASSTRTDSLISFGSESSVHFAPSNVRDLEVGTLEVVTHVRPFGDGVAQPATYKLFSESRSELSSTSTEMVQNPFE